MLEEEEAPVYTIKKRWWWIRGLLLEETLGRLSGTCLKRSGSEIYIVKKKTKELSWSTSRVSVWYFLPRLAWAFHLLGQDSCNVQRGKRCCCWAKTRRCWEPLIIIIVVLVVYSALLRSPLSSFLFLKKVYSLQSCIFNNRRIFDALNNGIGVRTQVRYSSSLPSAKFCAKRW